MTLRQAEILWSIAFLVLASWIFLTATELSGGAGRFPEVAAALIGVSAATTLVKRLVRPKADPGDAPFAEVEWLRLAIIVGAFALALVLLRPLGFPIVTLALFFVCALAAEDGAPTPRGALVALVTALGVVAVLTAVFAVLLGVSLPMGPLGP